MQKILVTTDFSNASKAGLRFAIQLASQIDVELVFFHCFQALIPMTINSGRIENALQQQNQLNLKKLEGFVAKIYKSMSVQAGPYKCVVLDYLSPESAILEYARNHEFQYICMSTRGASSIQKIIGTHTGSILQRSSTPVWVVPHTYRVRPIQKILYSSDLENFNPEMEQVAALAADLKVKTDVGHFYFPGEISLDRESLLQMWRIKYPQLDQVYLEPYNLNSSFSAQLDALAKKKKPSIIAFFTHTKKTWFDKLFGPSVSESVSFVTKVPMLVFRKRPG